MKFVSIPQRLLIWFLLIALLPLLLVGYSLLRKFETELQQSVANKISTIADKKVDQIDSYFDGLLKDAYIVAQGNTSRKAVVELSREFFRGGPESAAYWQLETGYRDYCKRFLGVGKYYDLFLISPQGTVVYSQRHEADFASNLYNGPYRNSGLGKVAKNALTSMATGISGFELYLPSGSAPAAFIAVPLTVQGKVVGAFALQINSQHVFEVLLDNTGMGDSGETLVAHREDERTARIVVPLKSTPDAALKMTVTIDQQQHTLPLLHALNGERGSGYEIDYLGQPVVAAWRYLPRMDWGMVVKMDSAEALAPVRQMRIFALAIVALALAVSLLGALLLARRFVIPLQNLRDGAQQIAAGKLAQRVQVNAQDELGQLATSFNTMAEQLQISFARMKDAKEEAERANAAKSDFLSRMSHELRTPLNAILGFGQLLESDTEHPLTQTQIGNIREILQGGNHLLQMINEVLDLSRIESGRLEINMKL